MNQEMIKAIMEVYIEHEIQIHKDMIQYNDILPETRQIVKDRIKYFGILLKHLREGYNDEFIELMCEKLKEVKKSKKKD